MRIVTLLGGAAALFAITKGSPVDVSRALIEDSIGSVNLSAASTVGYGPPHVGYGAFAGGGTRRRVRRDSAQKADLTEEEFEALITKGCMLLGAMGAKDSEVSNFVPGIGGSAESQWRNPQDIADWGWTRANSVYFRDFERGKPDTTFLSAIGASSRRQHEGGPNWLHGWEHTTETVHDGVTYPSTAGMYCTIMNVDDGVMIGWSRWAPSYAGQHMKSPPVYTFPKLARWSDMAYIDWVQHANARQKPASNIQYFANLNIINDLTESIIEFVFDSPNLQDDCASFSWERRVSYPMDSEEGKALLASPNGNGIAWFLLQHKSTFGERTTVDRVEVWCKYEPIEDDPEGEDEAQINMLFHIRRQ
ncbi:hypothetical protein BU24DRAFT_451148 [Aaosphaeria arxii CBS 175.79]|uniref:Uncharacterized protein n=1 Tax=Aaosphaeria arxii CBS 175.79 TaxID=1450172 RepID=A0A6A5XWN5_9PLEO|nr:uncharacterized protein BU24DRAFT_451148 [Aaosphaeria arxii CBS 175.79]KAF2016664.1 hypothetical protein BU24DRAFT_451148 [Aaosphaeria arxii CBS 175.79]